MTYTWKLEITFGYDSPGYREQPGGDAAEFYQHVLRQWCVDEDDLEPGELTRTEETVTIQADMLDYLHGLILWSIMHTIPTRLELTRLTDE
jgi:hypothetical protein